jgi:signal peptidase I
MTSHSTFREVVHWVVGSVVLALVVRTWLVMGLVAPVTVAGKSMQPTLASGDRVLVDRAAFVWHGPARGDVVVFRCPSRADTLCVKRVAGLPGETIELAADGILADGQLVLAGTGYRLRREDWAAFRRRTESPENAPVRWLLGPEEFFVVGDNGPESDDSRSWWQGPGLSAKLLVGKAIGVR